MTNVYDVIPEGSEQVHGQFTITNALKHLGRVQSTYYLATWTSQYLFPFQ